MMRWIAFSAAVIGLSAAITVGSYLLTPGSAGAEMPLTGRDKLVGPPASVEVVEPIVHDFGNMAQKNDAQRDWTLTNKGEGEAVLRMGSVSCSCTIPKLDIRPDQKTGVDSLTLAPGASTKLTVSWKTKEFSGHYHQTAELLVSNDPKHDKYVFTIDGNVRPPVVAYPGNVVDFMRQSNDVPHTIEVPVVSFDRPETKITEAKVSNPDVLEATVKPLGPDECKALKVEKGMKLAITLKQGVPIGALNEEVLIKTDHPQKPGMSFTVTARVDGPISLTPGQFRLTDVSSKSGGSQSLRMSVRGQKETKFTVVKAPKGVEVAIAPAGTLGENSSQYRITVTVPAGTPSGGVSGEIIVKTDHPQAPELKIRVDVLIHAS